MLPCAGAHLSHGSVLANVVWQRGDSCSRDSWASTEPSKAPCGSVFYREELDPKGKQASKQDAPTAPSSFSVEALSDRDAPWAPTFPLPLWELGLTVQTPALQLSLFPLYLETCLVLVAPFSPCSPWGPWALYPPSPSSILSLPTRNQGPPEHSLPSSSVSHSPRISVQNETFSSHHHPQFAGSHLLTPEENYWWNLCLDWSFLELGWGLQDPAWKFLLGWRRIHQNLTTLFIVFSYFANKCSQRSDIPRPASQQAFSIQKYSVLQQADRETTTG